MKEHNVNHVVAGILLLVICVITGNSLASIDWDNCIPEDPVKVSSRYFLQVCVDGFYINYWQEDSIEYDEEFGLQRFRFYPMYSSEFKSTYHKLILEIYIQDFNYSHQGQIIDSTAPLGSRQLGGIILYYDDDGSEWSATINLNDRHMNEEGSSLYIIIDSWDEDDTQIATGRFAGVLVGGSSSDTTIGSSIELSEGSFQISLGW